MQPYLSESAGWTIGEDYREMASLGPIQDPDADAAINDAGQRAIVVADPVPGTVAQLTYSLVLDAETGIYVYVSPAEGFEGSVTASVDGGGRCDATPLPGGRYRIAIEGIPAHKLGDWHEIEIAVVGYSVRVRVSPFSYVNDVLKSDSGTFAGDDARKAVTSLYLYYKATMAYRGEPISAS
jgi:hypothetical protein